MAEDGRGVAMVMGGGVVTEGKGGLASHLSPGKRKLRRNSQHVQWGAGGLAS